ncbi:MAG: GFA family protein [Pseudomonadota bacterium]
MNPRAFQEGGCLCGQIRYRVYGPITHPAYCHCESCRRASGAPLVAWGTVMRAALIFTKGELAMASTSPDVERGYCLCCGSQITYWHRQRGTEIDVTLASLDNPALVAPQSHIWVADKLPWMEINDGLPQYPGEPGTEAIDDRVALSILP